MVFFLLALLQKVICEQVECIPQPDGSTSLPVEGYVDNTILYGCNQKLERVFVNASLLVILGCEFSGCHQSEGQGGAIYISIKKTATIVGSTSIYSCIFSSCQAATGGAIYLTSNDGNRFLNITKCTFNNNVAQGNGGAIYFNAIYTTIQYCTFLNNVGKGGDLYFKTGETKYTKTKNPLLISNCEFERNSEDTSRYMIYIEWTQYSDLAITSITAKIKTTQNIFLFGFPNMEIGASATLSCNMSFISLKKYICEDPKTSIGLVLSGNFTELPEEVDPDSNCPARPTGATNLKDGIKSFESQVLYGCEFAFQKEERVNGKYCIIYIYSCSFNSIKSEEKGGALYISTSYVDSNTPEGNCQIINCTFSECQGSKGGAACFDIQNSDRFTNIINCTFTNNRAVGQNIGLGGAIYLYTTYATIGKCSFINNAAEAKGDEIYFQIYENEDTENPLLIENCTFLHDVEQQASSLIFLEWRKEADLFFNRNSIKIGENVKTYLFDTDGQDILLGNMSCKNNALLPSHDYLCDKTTSLYDRIKYQFKNTEAPKDDISFENKNECTSDKTKHCQAISDENKADHVLIDTTTFTGYNHDGNGGAVYLINCGATTINSHFKQCESTKAGGAIYVFKESKNTDWIVFQEIEVESCSAIFGGGAYIYSSSDDDEVKIESSKFVSNVAQKTGDKNFFGGGAIYMTAKKGFINECSFKNNKGGTVKVNKNFDEKPTDNQNNEARNLNNKVVEFSLFISHCTIESEKNSKLSSLFVVGHELGKVEVNSCTFTGKLAKGTYHIDGESLPNEMKKIHVESCKFSSDSKQALNSKIVYVDLNKQVFNYNKNELPLKLLFSVASVGIICSALLAAFIIKSRKKADENHEVLSLELDAVSKVLI